MQTAAPMVSPPPAAGKYETGQPPDGSQPPGQGATRGRGYPIRTRGDRIVDGTPLRSGTRYRKPQYPDTGNPGG